MPAPRFKPFLANEPSTSDEVSTLELFLKKQLEDDVASDVYTECDIKSQEKQILNFLKSNVKLSDVKQSNKNKEDVIDSDIFLTPKCLSPYIENKFEPSSCLSPSVEITKQYYALVPGSLEQELIEQDALSSAFKTIIETQDKELSKIVKRSKPSSLSLSSSHSSQIKRSSSCDILNKTSCDITKTDNSCYPNKNLDSDLLSKIKSEDCSDSINDKIDQAYSPDSLITDDPSSSSDYLSAAHTFSPGVNTTGFSQLNVGESINKVDNIFTSSDSGFENTGMMESLSSHKDVTITDLSMTESIIQDIMPLDTNEALNPSNTSTEQPESYYSFNCNSSSNILNSSAPIPIKDSSLRSFTSDRSDGGTISMNSMDKSNETPTNVKKSRYNESTPILSGGSLLESIESLKSTTQPNSPSIRRKVDNIPIVTGSFVESEPNIVAPKPPKTNTSSAWVIDLSAIEDKEISRQDFSVNKPCDRTCESLKSEVRSCSTSENCSKSRSSVDSDGSEKSSHKFYIDFSSIPDPLPQEKTVNNDNKTEKKNMFSMYIDFNNSATVKEKPRRLSSNSRKSTSETKCNKTEKTDNKVAPADITTTETELDDNKGTFELYESLCNNLNIRISDIIAETNVAPTTDSSEQKSLETVEEVNVKPEIKTAPVIHEEVETAESLDEFVKLSDLDKPVLKPDIDPHIPETKKNFDDRMTRSIPENNWGEVAYTVTSRSIEVISSFHSENALSLNRLFPHLKNEFSKSMPITFCGRTRSPFKSGVPSSTGEIDETSDVSEISSVQSSMCRSVIENSTTEDTSQSSNIIGNSQSRLGQDLLRMFLEEIAPDVIVEVSGKRIKAHKCILSSRCQYFAGILSGGWVESAGNIIVLPPFSFNVVHFALCHIYSGLSTIPDSISIVELATIADMLGLEGLKEAIMYTLKSKYCHHFHTPCQVCTAGVLECFPLSSVYGLDDLYRKCLRWITKHFSTVWPTKAFATLPKELLDKCYHEHLNNFKTENVIDTVYGCGITVASLHNSRWAEIVENMCRRLVNAAAQFLAKNLLDFFKQIATIPADAPHAAKDALDNCLSAAIEWAPPDETLKSYAFLSNVVSEIKSQHLFQPDLITNSDQIWRTLEQNSLLYNSATTWRLQCESALVRAAPRVVGLQAFKDLPPDLRRRLRELGCIMYGPQVIATTAHQERKSRSKTEKVSPANRSLDMEKVRASFVPYKAKPVNVMGSIDELKCNEYRDMRKSKRNPPKIRTTKAQEERAKYNQSKTRTQPVKPVAPINFQNTRPRYLDPIRKERDKKSPESSESSRNSSPIKTRFSRLESKREHRMGAISQDSLASTSRPRTAEPSTDSLSESQVSNKYATYTKAKHKNKGSVEQLPSNIQVLTHTHGKTKIPVYVNQKLGPNNGPKPYEPSKPIKIHSLSSHNGTNRNCLGSSPRTNRQHESRKLTVTKNPSISMCNSLPNKDSKSLNDRKTKEVSRSLMNATKSSSAKIVPKATKEPAKKPTKAVTTKKNGKQDAYNNNGFALTKDIRPVPIYVEPHEIPVLERSSTFSKDEPTFDKMENVDDKV
ncbi:uncharacterized protein LOC121739428 isoform X2 [Aricia agestis]|uniref:uncharacterized protein LOC121739428 isoform X2 n=1 Tax=Aricia agestis TaxID=91739 RepID=UPI001C207AC4|nr:uncharacterized protein LOC121739428 isoform X2 [Aricia agestis]